MKLLDQGIANVGGKTQTIFDLRKLKNILLKKFLQLNKSNPKNSSLNLSKLKKLLKKYLKMSLIKN